MKKDKFPVMKNCINLKAILVSFPRLLQEFFMLLMLNPVSCNILILKESELVK